MTTKNPIRACIAGAMLIAASMALAFPAFAGIKVDLSRVDQKSAAYKRFKGWVDAAVGGRPGYAFAATDATLMFRLTGSAKYCELAVSMVEQQVTEAEAEITKGGRPRIAGDSYLEVGPMIAELAHTFDACGERLSPEQKLRWSAYAGLATAPALFHLHHWARTWPEATPRSPFAASVWR